MIETGITITVLADEEYSYEVHADPSLIGIEYKEVGQKTKQYISFGSLDEMKAVAEAMLKVVQVST
jgi:hypothetical protein